jgi:hypothetical protein
MIEKKFEVRVSMGSFPKQDLDSLIGSKQVEVKPFSGGNEFDYGNYNGCSIQLYVSNNPHLNSQQVNISGEPKDVKEVVEELHEKYSWANGLTFD